MEQAVAASSEAGAGGGWRGRAQQIIMLKAKVKRLEAAAAAADGMSLAPGNAMMSSMHTGLASDTSHVSSHVSHHRRGNDVDSKAVADLSSMHSERLQVLTLAYSLYLSLSSKSDSLPLSVRVK